MPKSLHLAMLAQAEAELPNECCGLLAGHIVGDEGRVVARYPLVNTAASPVEFLSDGPSHLAASKDMRARGIIELAIYHSHPTTHPVPSKKDLAQSWGPIVVSLILSLKSRPVEVRAWWLSETEYREAQWRLEVV